MTENSHKSTCLILSSPRPFIFNTRYFLENIFFICIHQGIKSTLYVQSQLCRSSPMDRLSNVAADFITGSVGTTCFDMTAIKTN